MTDTHAKSPWMLTEPMLRDYYAAWLREALEESGMPQAELGRRIGLTRNQVRRLTTGERVWDSQTVERVARHLRVPAPVTPGVTWDRQRQASAA